LITTSVGLLTIDFITYSKNGTGLWDELEGFYFDKLNTENDTYPMKVFSFVGLIPLFGASILSEKTLNKLPAFKRRMEWFIKYRPKLLMHIGSLSSPSLNSISTLNPSKANHHIRRIERSFVVAS